MDACVFCELFAAVPPAWSPPPECAAALSSGDQPWKGGCRGVAAPLPLSSAQLEVNSFMWARREGGDLQRQKRWVMTFEASHIWEWSSVIPRRGFLGNGGVWLNTTVEQKMGRHKRPGNIQKPLGELPKMCASLSINHDLISPSAWSSTGSVNYAFWLSSYPTGRGFLLCSLFEGKGHAFFNSTGALSYVMLALLSPRPLL